MGLVSQFDASIAMHDGSRWTPDKDLPEGESGLVCKIAGGDAKVGLKATEMLYRDRVVIDTIAPNQFTLTDIVTHEVVNLPKGVWRIETWDDFSRVCNLWAQGACR